MAGFEGPLNFEVSDEPFAGGAKRARKPVPESIVVACERSIKDNKPIRGDFSKADAENARRLAKKYVAEKYGDKKKVKSYTNATNDGKIRLTFQVVDATA